MAMGQSNATSPLRTVYENRIGTATNANEAMGYWVFLTGFVLGALGLFGYFGTDSASMGRGIGYAVAALAPAFLMGGAVLRFPLRKISTYIAEGGLVVTLAAVTWFLLIFPGGWSTTTGNAGVILTYVAGLGLIGIAGIAVPLETDSRVSDTDSTEDAVEEPEAQSAATGAELAAAEDEIEQLERDLEDSATDEDDLAAVIRDARTSESQFELFEDGGEQWRWRLRHKGGEVIGASNTSYDRQHDAQAGMQAVRRDALGATVLVINSEEELPEEGTTGGFVSADDTETLATFELYEGKAGDHRWRLRHDNGNILANGAQGYASRSGGKHSIEGIRRLVGPADYLHPDPTAIEVYRDQGGEYRWRLHHRNGNILGGSGEGYASRGGAQRAIDRLRAGIDDMDIEVYEDDASDFRWRLAGEDRKVKFDSGGYESRGGARDAAERVKGFLPEADMIDIEEAAFDVYEDDGGDHRWRLRHRNGNTLANGAQGYADRSGVWDGIESVKRNAPNAPVEELEE